MASHGQPEVIFVPGLRHPAVVVAASPCGALQCTQWPAGILQLLLQREQDDGSRNFKGQEQNHQGSELSVIVSTLWQTNHSY